MNPVSHEKKALLFHIIGEIKLSLFLNGCQKEIIDDSEQIRLARFCTTLEVLGHRFILSNSDLKGKNPDDDFFDKLYANFNIKRVYANRMVNAKPDKRGKLTELLITNIPIKQNKHVGSV